jgi:hypothetical protein
MAFAVFLIDQLGHHAGVAGIIYRAVAGKQVNCLLSVTATRWAGRW